MLKYVDGGMTIWLSLQLFFFIFFKGCRVTDYQKGLKGSTRLASITAACNFKR